MRNAILFVLLGSAPLGCGNSSLTDTGPVSGDGGANAEIGGGLDADNGARDAGPPLATPDMGLLPGDTGVDAGMDSGTDAGMDSGTDAGMDSGTDATADAGDASAPCGALELKLLTTGLSSPVYATAPAGDDRIFVLNRLEGRVVILDNIGIKATAFLDVSAQMSNVGYEAGLLSLVFHPDFAVNRTFYVSYTTANALRISRFKVPAATPDVADPASASLVIDIPKLTRHNTGGMLLFGPQGFLYVGVGDDDNEALGQNRGVLSGKLLRIGVDPSVDGYTIPPNNPFVGVQGVLPEIWAYGLREPFRFWFDGPTGDLYIGDVGDNALEEIDVVAGSKGGQNFGWPIMEGSACHTPASGCDKTGLEPPAYDYRHDTTDGIAVIGGSVYRGTALSACWRGRYFFGDYSNGWVRTFQWGGSVTDVKEEPGAMNPNFVSFGQDGHGEILMLGSDKTLHRIVSHQ